MLYRAQEIADKFGDGTPKLDVRGYVNESKYVKTNTAILELFLSKVAENKNISDDMGVTLVDFNTGTARNTTAEQKLTQAQQSVKTIGKYC